jgi:hypothetical protein
MATSFLVGLMAGLEKQYSVAIERRPLGRACFQGKRRKPPAASDVGEAERHVNNLKWSGRNDKHGRKTLDPLGSARSARVCGDSPPANVCNPECPHVDRTVAGTDGLYRYRDEAIAHHSGEYRGGKPIRHQNRLGYTEVCRTGEYPEHVAAFTAKAWCG